MSLSLRQVETSGMVGDAIRRLPSFHGCLPLLTRDEMLRGLKAKQRDQRPWLWIAFTSGARQFPSWGPETEGEAGVREGEERARLERCLRAFEIVRLDLSLAVQGGLYRRDYSTSHNIGLADAFIAATATRRQVPLVTRNRRHFPMLQDVIVPYHKEQDNTVPDAGREPTG